MRAILLPSPLLIVDGKVILMAPVRLNLTALLQPTRTCLHIFSGAKRSGTYQVRSPRDDRYMMERKTLPLRAATVRILLVQYFDGFMTIRYIGLL